MKLRIDSAKKPKTNMKYLKVKLSKFLAMCLFGQKRYMNNIKNTPQAP